MLLLREASKWFTGIQQEVRVPEGKYPNMEFQVPKTRI